MTNTIQRNAANILAISLLLFSNAAPAQANKLSLGLSRPFKDALPVIQNNSEAISAVLLPA